MKQQEPEEGWDEGLLLTAIMCIVSSLQVSRWLRSFSPVGRQVSSTESFLTTDVFYTNSRYAKVGGLPSHELNQLELQFLLLNDFRLVILPEEMQRYGDRLLGYYEDQEEKRTTEAKRTDSEAVQTTQIEVDSSAKSQTNGSALEQPADNSQPPRVSQPTHNSSAPPSAPSSTIEPQAAPSRHRESKSGSVSFAEPPRPHHPPSHGGLRSWVSGTVGGEVMSGRVASPMCD